jgi:hypothetical protein
MEDLTSSSLKPLIYDVFEDGDVDFKKQSTIFSSLEFFYLEQHHQSFHPFYDSLEIEFKGCAKEDEGVDSWNVNHQEHSHNILDEKDISWHAFEDPFTSCLQEVNSPKVSYFIKFEFVCKILDEFPLNSFFIFPLKKHMQRNHPMEKNLAWLHWVFLFYLIKQRFSAS